MSHFSGIWVPLVTPFRQGALDLPALKQLAASLIAAGVSGVVVCGTTGEAAALSHDEQLQALDAVLEVVPASQVVMGLAGNHLPSILAMQDAIQQRPVAGLLVAAPYYIRPTQAALAHYFTTLADRTHLPIILYNVPYRTGIALEWETLRTLSDHPRIVAIKDCGGNAELTLDLINDGKLDVMTGEDTQMLTLLALGGTGAITASAHLCPERFVALVQQVEAGNLRAARATFFGLLPMIRLLFSIANPVAIKCALALQGQMENELREPMLAAPAGVEQALRDYFTLHTR
jgi:4-hydroxy-tetrahydrodipicolinate synthase